MMANLQIFLRQIELCKIYQTENKEMSLFGELHT
jgi:hypothetical protein